jgi:hypothetical protein
MTANNATPPAVFDEARCREMFEEFALTGGPYPFPLEMNEQGFYRDGLTRTAYLGFLSAARIYSAGWRDIASAPKNTPILAYCNHEADSYVADTELSTLTLYAAHAEGLSHAETGIHIVEWGGAFDDRTWEDTSGAHMPDWWFVVGSEFEKAANPTHWMPLPPPPAAERE